MADNIKVIHYFNQFIGGREVKSRPTSPYGERS